MSAPRGWPSQQKDDRLDAEYVTVEPVRQLQHALSTVAHSFVREVGTDAVEANSTTKVIVATAHAAIKGDVIRFTSGTHSGREVKVKSVSANEITLAETLSSAPSALDTFQILRHKYPLVGADGTIPVSSSSNTVAFIRDGVSQVVTEDTVTPANNCPLPVKLTDVTGDITITAQNLNVQSTHTGANPDSMQLGDGVETLSITAAGQAEVAVTSALPSGTNNIGDVDILTEPATAADAGALPAVVKVIGGYDGTNVQAVKTDTDGELQVDVLSQPARSHLTDSYKVGDGVDFLAISGSGEASVAVTSALPAGTNNIGDVDVLTEPATAADGGALPALTKVISGYDGANVQAIKTDAAGELQIDVLTQPARSHTTDSTRVGDGIDFLAISAAGEASVAVISSLPAGNNNIGDVDIASALPAGTNTIGKVDINYLSVVDFLDSGLVAGTSIAGSAGAFFEVVASTAATVKKVQVMDTTGAFIGVYTGAGGGEALKFIYGPGSDQTIEVSIASGTRISLRSMEASAPAGGSVAMNFLG